MIIGISGYAGSGKDTVAKLMQKHLKTQYKENWEIRKFAQKVKDIASIISGASVEDFENQDFKKSYMSKEWGPMTYRHLLQKIGTECMRDNLHKNVWVIALMHEYDNFSNWIISDVRFPNEAEAIKKKDGIIIRINRTMESFEKLQLHESETSLDNWKFDFIISNEGSLGNLQTEVINFIDYVKATKRIL